MMLQDILSYIAHNPDALCWGFGFGLMVGTVLVAIGAARQYVKGYRQGKEDGYHRWAHGLRKEDK